MCGVTGQSVGSRGFKVQKNRILRNTQKWFNKMTQEKNIDLLLIEIIYDVISYLQHFVRSFSFEQSCPALLASRGLGYYDL